ncbi:hypothetical protein PInf_025582 [Phytophthora infestans]|nr:hypothetical protein PInf_005089 [Phytophthora infestans]KAI9986629.1 hypothetical protein PInf_025582 [Phytophthora infestans]
MSSTLVHKNAADTYGWAKLVALKNFAFVHIDDPVIRAAVRYKAMDRKPLQKHEAAMTAAEHIEFLDMILDHYSLDIANMVAIVADNMETIKAISC